MKKIVLVLCTFDSTMVLDSVEVLCNKILLHCYILYEPYSRPRNPRFLGWGIFLKIRVFLRLLFFTSLISSFITVTSSLRAVINFICVIFYFLSVRFAYGNSVCSCYFNLSDYKLFYKQHYYRQCQAAVGKKSSKW